MCCRPLLSIRSDQMRLAFRRLKMLSERDVASMKQIEDAVREERERERQRE